MKKISVLIISIFVSTAIFSQEKTWIKNYLEEVKSPIYLDARGSIFPGPFGSVSAGVQLNRNWGIGAEVTFNPQTSFSFSQGTVGFTGRGLQLRHTTPRFASYLSSGVVRDVPVYYDYLPNEDTDYYLQLGTGIRFWKVFHLGLNCFSTTKLRLGRYDDYSELPEFIISEKRSLGVNLTLGVTLLPSYSETMPLKESWQSFKESVN